MATSIILSKESSEAQIKRYFESVLKLSQTDNEFPININDVWMLAYSEKGKAVRALKDTFYEGEDYYLAQNGKAIKSDEIQNGVNVDYMLSIPCLEYFIARKVRPVFEVYRKVFHKVVTGRKEVIYTEREVKSHLLSAEKALRESSEQVKNLEAEKIDLEAKVSTLTQLYSEEVTLKLMLMTFIRMYDLTEDFEKYRKVF